MKEDNRTIIVEILSETPIDKVWKAITEVDLMTQWFFENIPDFKPEVGFKTEFNVSTEERDFLHQWQVLEVSPVKKIAYSWEYAQYPGVGKVIFELFAKNEHTLLRLTALGMETFPDDIPEFKRESCQAGWDYFIGQQLKTFLEATQSPNKI